MNIERTWIKSKRTSSIREATVLNMRPKVKHFHSLVHFRMESTIPANQPPSLDAKKSSRIESSEPMKCASIESTTTSGLPLSSSKFMNFTSSKTSHTKILQIIQKAKRVKMHPELEALDRCLPHIFRSHSFSYKLFEELRRHHK